jgi:hypothetical protein
MKRYFFIGFIFTFFIGFSQNRINDILPTISQNNGIITNSIGWLKNNSGQWIKSKNKIPNDLGTDQKLLENYEKYSVGIDNFISFEIKEIKIKANNYILLIKKYKDGFYKYETIEKGWEPNNSYKYYVIDSNEISKIESVEHNKEVNLKLKIILSGDVKYIDLKTLTTNKIANEINKKLKESNTYFLDFKLGLYINCLDEKKIVQFYFYDSFSGIDVEENTKYYETNYENFNQFINIE